MPQRTLRLEARTENLERILAFVADGAEELSWTAPRLTNIELAVEEAAINVCNHAYPEGAGTLEISSEGDDERFTVVLADKGFPFDPTTAPEPDLTAGIDEREVGGLGCFLIRSLADQVRWCREGDRNVLEMIFLRDVKKK